LFRLGRSWSFRIPGKRRYNYVEPHQLLVGSHNLHLTVVHLIIIILLPHPPNPNPSHHYNNGCPSESRNAQRNDQPPSTPPSSAISSNNPRNLLTNSPDSPAVRQRHHLALGAEATRCGLFHDDVEFLPINQLLRACRFPGRLPMFEGEGRVPEPRLLAKQ
jgi:hypothetical protein